MCSLYRGRKNLNGNSAYMTAGHTVKSLLSGSGSESESEGETESITVKSAG